MLDDLPQMMQFWVSFLEIGSCILLILADSILVFDYLVNLELQEDHNNQKPLLKLRRIAEILYQ